MQRSLDRWMSFALVAMLAVLCLLVLPTCANGTLNEGEEVAADTTTPACTLDVVQHPFRDAVALSGGRGFLASGNHLGWDLMAPEGLPVYAIGCGVVRLVRAANGYGTLVVVIEHRLREPILMTNGRGTRVTVTSALSIYGHLRPTSEGGDRGLSTGLHVGDVVTPETVIGYIEHRSRNGDGDEHLHLGIRLQNTLAAQRSDPSGWFRGYDTTPSQRSWFADPQSFLRELSAVLVEKTPRPVPVLDAGVSRSADVQEDRAAQIDILVPEDVPMIGALDVRIRDVQDSASEDGSLPVHMDAGVALRQDDGPSRPPDSVSTPSRIRYEFRVRSALRVSPPYYLRDHWWRMSVCDNTASTTMEIVGGWARCDAERLELFDGSFFVPDHPDWGDRGQIGTVANTPNRCTYVEGAEWRLTELETQRVLFQGQVSSLQCRGVGAQDRLVFPE